MGASDRNQCDYIKGEEFEEKLLAQELQHIRKQHKDVDKSNLFGLAFSGGGIRSATFSLGVMQALAEKRWLKKFHYLSTVSGGGYIGSALTWLLAHGKNCSEKRFDTEENFPFKKFFGRTTGKGVKESRSLIRRLRHNGNYLTPGQGITKASLIAVILRGAILSLLTFGTPLLLGVTALIHFDLFPPYNDNILANQVIGLSLLVIGVFVFLSLLYGLCSRAPFSTHRAYRIRRWFEKQAGKILKVSALLLVVGSLPVVYHYLATFDAAPETASGLTLAGVITAILSIYKSQNKEEGKLPLGLIAPLAMAMLVYGILLLFYWISLNNTDLIWQWKWYGVALVFILSFTVNINYLSIHRFYRDRLMELFMPNKESPCDGASIATEADGSALHDMCDFENGTTGPYHLINTNMVSIDSNNNKLNGRGGENFLLSPKYCGSEVTGWQETKKYMGGKMNLATAMAISGAAADPHGAPGGEGLTRNRSVSLLMALFNVRLGYWAPNPKGGLMLYTNSPNWLVHGLREMFGFGLNEESRYVHLADGGHYENLALYELIRRKVKTIVLCDGGADPGFTFIDFANCVEKIRVDFGADIKMPSFLEMCPKPDLNEFGNRRSPYAVDLADSGFISGTISYQDGTSGRLIYIKTTLINKLPKDIYGYKSSHPEFPDESTADQFFDEKQFEAYRELGYRLGRSIAEDDEVKTLFA